MGLDGVKAKLAPAWLDMVQHAFHIAISDNGCQAFIPTVGFLPYSEQVSLPEHGILSGTNPLGLTRGLGETVVGLPLLKLKENIHMRHRPDA